MTPEKLIKYRRKELKMSMQELADKMGVAKSSVANWETNGIDNMKNSNVAKLAKYLDISPLELLGLNEVSPVSPIPIVGQIACGSPILGDDNIDGYFNFPTDQLPSGTNFATRASGDSMFPTIKDGAMVIIHMQPEVEENQIAAVQIDGDVTLKRYHEEKGVKMLLPDNRNYRPIVLDPSSQVRIVGRAVYVADTL